MTVPVVGSVWARREDGVRVRVVAHGSHAVVIERADGQPFAEYGARYACTIGSFADLHTPAPRDLAEHVTDDSIEARHTDQGATAIASTEGGST